MRSFFVMPAALAATQQRAWRISLSLTMLRLLLAPVMLWCTWHVAASWPLVLLLVAALASDVLDGRVLAWVAVHAPGLRALDSAVDTVFYLSAAIAAWHRNPADLVRYRWAIAVVVFLELFNNAFALLKYGRTPGYHAWSAKLFGLGLFCSLALLLAGTPWTLLPVTLALGTVSQLESVGITLMLSGWTHDVPSVWHAWRQRRQ